MHPYQGFEWMSLEPRRDAPPPSPPPMRRKPPPDPVAVTLKTLRREQKRLRRRVRVVERSRDLLMVRLVEERGHILVSLLLLQ